MRFWLSTSAPTLVQGFNCAISERVITSNGCLSLLQFERSSTSLHFFPLRSGQIPWPRLR